MLYAVHLPTSIYNYTTPGIPSVISGIIDALKSPLIIIIDSPLFVYNMLVAFSSLYCFVLLLELDLNLYCFVLLLELDLNLKVRLKQEACTN